MRPTELISFVSLATEPEIVNILNLRVADNGFTLRVTLPSIIISTKYSGSVCIVLQSIIVNYILIMLIVIIILINRNNNHNNDNDDIHKENIIFS